MPKRTRGGEVIWGTDLADLRDESDDDESSSSIVEQLVDRAEPLGKDRLVALSGAATRFLEDRRGGEADAKQRREFLSAIQETASKVWGLEKCKIVPFGSSVTGLCHSQSDLDVCIFVDRRDARGVLGSLQKPFAKLCTRVNFIRNAAVPILKCSGGPYEFDLCCNMPGGVECANILKHFIGLDARVAPLLFYLQEVTQSAGIKNSPSQLLSSFAINISAIHYLQWVARPSVLPFCVMAFDDKLGDVTFRRERKVHDGVNEDTVGALLHGYLVWFQRCIRHAQRKGHQVWLDIRHQSARGGEPLWVDRYPDPDKCGVGMVNPVEPDRDITRNIKTRHWRIIERGLGDIVRYLSTAQPSVSNFLPPRVGSPSARHTGRDDRGAPNAKRRRQRR